jgi:RND superfamily putative drug exporter
VMVTLLPALLVICGRWVFWPFVPRYGSEEPTASGLWARIGNGIDKRPRTVWLVTAGVLAVLCLGFLRMDTSGTPSDEIYAGDTVDSVVGQELLSEHQLVDASTPVQVVTSAADAEAVARAMTGIEGLDTPLPPFVEGDVAMVQASLQADSLAEQSKDAVLEVRERVHAVSDDAQVTGWTALTMDIMEASERDNRVIIPIVLAAVLLILVALLRALTAPLVLVATVVLSFGAALGISGLVFDLVYDLPNVDPGFPLFAFVFLVALGIDYNIFLMTRVREETIEHGTRRGSLIALSSTGGVITSAGFVLAATFAMLATMPMTFALQIGTTIALGVLLDTMVVRSVLVTALNLDLGSRIWWPSRLARAGRTDGQRPEDPESEKVPALT